MIGIPTRVMYLWKRRDAPEECFTSVRLTPEAGFHSITSEIKGYTSREVQNVSEIEQNLPILILFSGPGTRTAE